MVVDNGLLGTYGDFLGGILGTFVTVYGTLMLIRTFQNQIKTNELAQSTNEMLLGATANNNLLVKMQSFTSQFEVFKNLYNEAINDYKIEGRAEKGREGLEELFKEFLERDFQNKATYGKRINSAVKEYEDFYSLHREQMSVHLRMLYQLMHFISYTQDIDERAKIEYAKAIRGNLSEAELVFIRYNCRCPYGRKMQTFVNEFNLLKHLPLMSLFEFRKWSEILDDDQQRTAINATFISLRKQLCDMILGTFPIAENNLECGKKWNFVIMYRKSDNTLFIKLQNHKKISRRGTITPNIERAFDKLGIKNLEGLFADYFRELFFYSNFCIYNNKDKVRFSHKGERNKNNINEIRFMFKSDYPLILSQRQISSPQ